MVNELKLSHPYPWPIVETRPYRNELVQDHTTHRLLSRLGTTRQRREIIMPEVHRARQDTTRVGGEIECNRMALRARQGCILHSDI